MMRQKQEKVSGMTSEIFWDHHSRNWDAQVETLYVQACEKTLDCTLPYLRAGDRVLDFACGTGDLTLGMAARVARVQAIDISEEMVRRTAEKARTQGAENVEVYRTDLFDLRLEEGGYDVVTAFNVLCYMDDQDRVLARIRRLLKPGGLFLSVTDCLGERPTREGLQKLWRSRTGSMPYVAFYRIGGLEETVSRAGFLILERERLFRVPPRLFIAARKGGN